MTTPLSACQPNMDIPASVADVIRYQQQQLFCEQVPLSRLAADYGTPLYLYSQQILQRQIAALTAVHPPQTLACFAVKANGNPTLLRLLADAGLGADVTSGGELFLAQHAGFPADKIIFSGVGKTAAEIEAAIQAGIRALHIESEQEFAQVATIAGHLQKEVAIGVRVNPDIAVATHPYISTGHKENKFGVQPALAFALYRQAQTHPWLRPVGVACHLGSQITELAPYQQAGDFLLTFAAKLRSEGISPTYLDIGGGLGIDYANDVPLPAAWLTAVSTPIHAAGYQLVIEPGRVLIGPAGLLLTQVTYTKQQGHKRYIIVDAGMNDLLRPAFYNAYHPAVPVQQPAPAAPWQTVDLVGPICESSDWLAQERPLPLLRRGDLLAILHAGAYSFAMSSNYNSRLRPPELLITGNAVQLIRRRQHYRHLLDGTTG